MQELYALLIAHYVVHEAALQAELDPDRLSFTHAVNKDGEITGLLSVNPYTGVVWYRRVQAAKKISHSRLFLRAHPTSGDRKRRKGSFADPRRRHC